MILPVQAALERVPASLIEASADLGARPGQTFRAVIFPLALPGIVAGSIFTFSLTLGDYIIPQIVGNSRLFIGQAVYAQQGTAGNIPLAAAFTVVPIVIMGFYLTVAKRLGAFDALEAHPQFVVIAGLDPAIHSVTAEIVASARNGCPDQVRA